MNKKYLLATFLFALSLAPAMAQVNQGGVTTVQTSTQTNIFVRPFCRFGLQFLASSLSKSNNGNGSGGVSVTQVLGPNGNPMRCMEDVDAPGSRPVPMTMRTQ